MARDFLSFRIRRPAGGFRLIRRPEVAIIPAGRTAVGMFTTWPPENLEARDALLRELEALEPQPKALLAFCNRYGRFGAFPTELDTSPSLYGERVADVALELALWHRARALHADLRAPRDVAEYVQAVGPYWSLRLPTPEKPGRLSPRLALTLRPEGDSLLVGPADTAWKDAREAAAGWLDRLVVAYLDAFSRWEREGRTYGLRIETALGIAWHALATGAEPRRCARPDCVKVFTPSLLHRRGGAAYCSPTCARWGQRHGYVEGKAPKRRRRS